MSSRLQFISKLLNISTNGITESINDLRDKEFAGARLSTEEKIALANFDAYRLQVLNSQQNEEEFHNKYRQIQVIANLGDWREFLKPEFSAPRS
jgi:hypothetical protein